MIRYLAPLPGKRAKLHLIRHIREWQIRGYEVDGAPAVVETVCGREAIGRVREGEWDDRTMCVRCRAAMSDGE